MVITGNLVTMSFMTKYLFLIQNLTFSPMTKEVVLIERHFFFFVDLIRYTSHCINKCKTTIKEYNSTCLMSTS